MNHRDEAGAAGSPRSSLCEIRTPGLLGTGTVSDMVAQLASVVRMPRVDVIGSQPSECPTRAADALHAATM